MTNTNNTPAQQVLNIMDASINEMMEKIVSNMVEEAAKNNQQFKPSARDFMLVKYGLVIDLLKSVEKYTLPTDIVIKLESLISPKGFTIYATIEREGQQYKYNTDVIIAGGHNIQCLHYRYITNTNLPRINASFDMVNAYKAEMKKVKAEQKLINEISSYQLRIAETEERIANEERVSDDEILAQAPSYFTMKYQELSDGHSFGSEQEFLNWQKEGLKDTIATFRKHTNWKREYVSDYKKSIKKLEEKLSKLN
jgi:hypothetical protein